MSTLDKLSEWYTAWLQEQNLPSMDAMELLHTELTEKQRIIVTRFVQLWEALEQE